jgi:hypothetical protein
MVIRAINCSILGRPATQGQLKLVNQVPSGVSKPEKQKTQRKTPESKAPRRKAF